MSELKSFIDETFNNLKSKIEEEYNNKIKEHFTKISIDVSNDSYSNEEYGKIDIGKIKHPEGRYIIHQIEFGRDNYDLILDPLQNGHIHMYNQKYNSTVKYKNIKELFIPGTILIDNFGERYIFIKSFSNYNGNLLKYTNEHSPNIKGNPHHTINILKIIDFEYQLIPSKNEYEYPLTNKIIDFVKSQNFPIDNLNILSKTMASIEIFKKVYNELSDKNEEFEDDIEIKYYENKELENKNKELNQKNNELLSKIYIQSSQIQDIQSKLDEQLKLNETLCKRLIELK
jgi:hypothetical protein